MQPARQPVMECFSATVLLPAAAKLLLHVQEFFSKFFFSKNRWVSGRDKRIVSVNGGFILRNRKRDLKVIVVRFG